MSIKDISLVLCVQVHKNKQLFRFFSSMMVLQYKTLLAHVSAKGIVTQIKIIK